MVVMSSTASVNMRTWRSHASLKTSMFSMATFDLGRAARILAALMTCGQRLSIWSAAILTSFTPSSLLDMEHARLATCPTVKAFHEDTITVGFKHEGVNLHQFAGKFSGGLH